MLESVVAQAPLFLLVAVRCFAAVMSLPLLSSRSLPRAAKVALAGFLAFFVFSRVSLSSGQFAAYAPYISLSGNFDLMYVLLLAGEALIGIILGFMVKLVFAAFSTAGQFFAFQMGLSASEVYDSLSQVENPIMGQFFNFMAILVFLESGWMSRFLLDGVLQSFDALNVFSVLSHTEELARFMMISLSSLFADAFIIALPVMASLFLINVTVGILSKAAPQMNLLSEGFPILMLTAYFLITHLVPLFIDFFGACIQDGFAAIEHLFILMSGVAS